MMAYGSTVCVVLTVLTGAHLCSAELDVVDSIARAARSMSSQHLAQSISLLQTELAHRADITAHQHPTKAVPPSVQFVHKSTYAAANPPVAAAFARKYLGADQGDPNRHKCGIISTARWT